MISKKLIFLLINQSITQKNPLNETVLSRPYGGGFLEYPKQAVTGFLHMQKSLKWKKKMLGFYLLLIAVGVE